MNAAIRLASIFLCTLALSAFADDDTQPITDGTVPAELMVPPDAEPVAAKPTAAPPAAESARPAAAYATRVCFAPQEACAKQLMKLLNSATKSLDIAIYHVNDEKIARKIAQKAKKVAVRVVADERQSKGDRSSIPGLAKAGVNLRFGKQRGIFHDQFVIVDGKRVETGSFNFTTHAFSENQENQIYTSEVAVIDRYQKQFEKIWASARPWRKPPELVIGRKDKAKPAREVASAAPTPAPVTARPGLPGYQVPQPRAAMPSAAHAAPASAASAAPTAAAPVPTPAAPEPVAPPAPDANAPQGDW